MGGNAIRAVELARALSAHADVTLAAPDGPGGGGPAHVPLDTMDPRSLRPHLAAADVVLSTPQSPLMAAELRRARARVVYDLYDPGPLEALQAFAGASRTRRALTSTLALDAALDALASGDSFVCASERQRDLWIGAMLALRLITPAVWDRDPSLREAIDVVPFGVPDAPPAPGPGARARFPALGDDAEVVLWNGGVWNWMDPVGAVRAVARLVEDRPRARLVFMGRPPPAPAEAAAATAARGLAAELGLLDRVVFFNDEWVPYEERGAWLLDAACALTAHHDDLETRYSFRTRVLDCLWASLPVVCTAGDELSERVARDDLGAVCPPEDPEAMARGLARVLERGRDAYAEGLARAAADHRWARVAEPLVRHVTGPGGPPLGNPTTRHLARPLQRLRAVATRALRRVALLRR